MNATIQPLGFQPDRAYLSAESLCAADTTDLTDTDDDECPLTHSDFFAILLALSALTAPETETGDARRCAGYNRWRVLMRWATDYHFSALRYGDVTAIARGLHLSRSCVSRHAVEIAEDDVLGMVLHMHTATATDRT